jgi:hypothetical protein
MAVYSVAVRSVVAVLVVLVFAHSVHAADTQAGTWKINMAESKFNGAKAPKNQVTTIEAIEGGVTNVTDILDAEGKSIHYEFTVIYGDKDYPVKGDPARDTVAVKKIDEYTFEITNKKAGKVVSSVRAEYARDGKTRTMTTSGTNAQGEKTTTVTVWDRQ